MKKTSPKSEIKGQNAKNKPTLVAFLLDRSGSMDSCKDETIKGFNGYVDKLMADAPDTMRFTFTQFDSIGVDVELDCVALKKVTRLNGNNYTPRANTPLYDAIGKTVRATEKSAGAKYKVLFVTLTDGQENSSSEWTHATVQKLMKEKEDQDMWTFAHIGVGTRAWEATKHLARGTKSFSNVMNVSRGAGGQSVNSMASVTCCFAADLSAGVSKSAESIYKGHAAEKLQADEDLK